MSKRIQHQAEYILLRGSCSLIAVLPYRLALCVANGITRLVFWLMRSRRQEAIRRIRSVMGDSYPIRQARTDAWHSLRNVTFNLVELIHMRGRTTPHPGIQLDMTRVLEQLKAYAEEFPGRGAIFACSHTGNWELAGLAAPIAGIELFTITGVQKNPLVQNYLQQLRHADGVELLPRDSGSTLRKIFSNLRKGKFLALMPDLRSRHPGVRVNFFGGHANLYQGMGHFARQTGVPVFLAVMKRQGWTHHTINLYGPFEPDKSIPKEEDAVRLSQQVMDLLDSEVRKEPGQWFWFNKRWILDPLEPDPDAEPQQDT
jgi:phosphatidylinositol dimannoside acyltransferase